MLRTSFITLLASFLAASANAQTPGSQVQSSASQEKIVFRSGHVTMCHVGKDCMEEIVAGRKYLVMKTDGFVLRVATGEDRKHGYADVSITNETGSPQQLNPANFRMEETEPRLHRLLYIDPNRLESASQPEFKPVKSDIGHGLPPPEYWTSDEHEQDKKLRSVSLVSSRVVMLRTGMIAPDTTVSGRIYFERPRTTQGVSVVLALPGALFEFPCHMEIERREKKHGMNQAAIEGLEAQS